jgi:hypothetical protein
MCLFDHVSSVYHHHHYFPIEEYHYHSNRRHHHRSDDLEWKVDRNCDDIRELCRGRHDDYGFRREHDADDRDERRRRKWDDEDDAWANRAFIRAEAVRVDDRADERVARRLQDADDMADVRAARRLRRAGVEANRAQGLARPLPLLLEDRHADRLRRREAARVAETIAR